MIKKILFALFVISLIAVISANSAHAQTLMEDNFDDNSIDGDLWVGMVGVTEQNQVLDFTGAEGAWENVNWQTADYWSANESTLVMRLNWTMDDTAGRRNHVFGWCAGPLHTSSGTRCDGAAAAISGFFLAYDTAANPDVRFTAWAGGVQDLSQDCFDLAPGAYQVEIRVNNSGGFNGTISNSTHSCNKTHKGFGVTEGNFSGYRHSGITQFIDNFSISYTDVAPQAPAEFPELRIGANDLYSGAPLDNFTVTISNATATLINSTQNGEVRFGTIANLSTYTVNISANNSAGLYFNATAQVTISLITNYNFTPYQVYAQFNASRIFTLVAINGLNISTASGGFQANTSTTDLAVLLLNASTYIISANATNFINVTTTSITFNALDNITTALFFGDIFVNVTAFDRNTNATINSGYTVVISPTNLSTSASFSTTTSSIHEMVLLAGFNYNFSANFTSGNVASVSKIFLINGNGNFSLFSQQVHSVFIEFYDETLNLLFWPYNDSFNESVNVAFIGPNIFNRSTRNGTLFVDNLTPGEYEIRYSAGSYDARSTFISLPSGGSNAVRAYLLNKTLSTLVTVTILDGNFDPINNSILRVQRLYPDEGIFRTIEMARANFNGDSFINIVTDIQEYLFFVDLPLGMNIFVSQTETKVTGTTLQIVIKPTSSRLGFVANLNGLQTSLNSTSLGGGNHTFVYTFSDVDGFIQTGCLRVEQQSLTGGPSLLCQVCDSGSLSTLTCNVNISGGTLNAYGIINTTNPHQVITNSLSIIVSTAIDTFGDTGLFLAAILFVSIMGISLFSLSGGIIAAIVALAVTAALGLFVVSASAIVALLLAGVIIIMKQRNE